MCRLHSHGDLDFDPRPGEPISHSRLNPQAEGMFFSPPTPARVETPTALSYEGLLNPPPSFVLG